MSGKVFQFAWECELIRSVQALISSYPFLLYVFRFFSLFGVSALAIVVTFFFYYGKDKEKGISLTLDVVGALVMGAGMKNTYLRYRPYMANKDITCLEPPYIYGDIYDAEIQGYSFPSLHATSSASFWTTLARHFRQKWLPWTGMAVTVLVMISRFALGVHYPTDVLAGALVGWAFVSLAAYLKKKLGLKRWLLVMCLFSSAGLLFATSNDYYQLLGLLYGFSGGYFFEEKYVDFAKTDKPLRMILRMLGALALALAVIEGVKLLLPIEALEESSLIFRTLRYGLGAFVITGVYPYLFRLEKD